MTNKVLLIYTGGTIGMGKNPITGSLEPLDFSHLLSQLPEFQYIRTIVETYQFPTPIDSSDMSPEFWAQLVGIISKQYDSYDGFVILHGTDTMAYTASALSFMLENLTKPVILTGSQLPIGQLRTDGKENLVTSIEIAGAYTPDGKPRVPEVCIYFNGKLLRGNRSTKIHADGFEAFNSCNYPTLCDAGVEFEYHPHYILQPDFSRPMVPHFEMDSRVLVFSLIPGIQENIVRQILETPDVRGIVMRTYGSGNAPQLPWLSRLLRLTADRGVNIINVTQCAAGRVEMGRYETGNHLRDAGVISGHDSTVEAAVTKLMLLQALHPADADSSAVQRIRALLSTSLAGEITL